MIAAENFEMTVKEVGMLSPKRLKITGVVKGDRLYRGDVVELISDSGRTTAFVQSIRIGRERLTSADPGQEVSIILPGVKKENVAQGARIVRSELGQWRAVDRDEEIEIPVNVLLLKKARRVYTALSPENRILRPVKLEILLACTVTLVLAVCQLVRAVAGGSDDIRVFVAVLRFFVVASLVVLLMWVCVKVCARLARRHIFFDSTPVKLLPDRIELSHREGSSVLKSEVLFSDIDSIEYYPRQGCVRVNAPVKISKEKNGEVIGTKFESSAEKAYQIYFLIYMDNDLFMRSVSERSGVEIETLGTVKPEMDGARY